MRLCNASGTGVSVSNAFCNISMTGSEIPFAYRNSSKSSGYISITVSEPTGTDFGSLP